VPLAASRLGAVAALAQRAGQDDGSVERAVAVFGASLGLDPAAARKLGRVGLYGRPVGATLARDRRPPRLLRAVDATGVEEPPEIQLRKSDREG
jgi:hypothetical protein